MNKEQKGFIDAQNEILSEHHQEYCSYQKMLLTSSTILLGILSVFRKEWTEHATVFQFIASSIVIIMFLSLVFGMLSQHYMVNSVGKHLNALNCEAVKASKGIPYSNVLHREPSKVENYLFRAQYISFYLSLVIMVIYFVLTLKWS